MRSQSAVLVAVLALVLAMGGCGEEDVNTGVIPVPYTPPHPSAELSGLTISAGTLSPVFSPETTFYLVGQACSSSSVTVTATASDPGTTIEVNGTAVQSGAPSSPIALDLGTNAVAVVVTAADGITRKSYTVRVFRGGPWAQRAYLKASNTNGIDYFGTAVAIDGDTIVVAANNERSRATGVNGDQTDNSGGTCGAAYVFVRTEGVWSQQAYLKASNTGDGDGFGGAVAISGDTIVVGAPLEASSATGVNGNQSDNSAGNSGAAYVFTRTGDVWSQQAYLKASYVHSWGAFGDTFGRAVVIDGDVIVVGAPQEDSNATGVNGNQANNSACGSGAAYVFTRTGGAWTQEAYLKASNTGAGDMFGCAVAVDGDTTVVGADWEDSSATGVNSNDSGNHAYSSGAAYVFTRTDGVWSQEAYLKASNTGFGDGFGTAIAISGDTVVVGAYYEASSATGVNGDQSDNSTPGTGAAYVFTRTGGVWSQQAYLKASNTETRGWFGRAVAVDGNTVVIGAHGEDRNGAAYVFARSGSVWIQQARLQASNADFGDQLGHAVVVSGGTVVVTTLYEDSSATGVNGDGSDNGAMDSGAAYVFR